MQRLAGKTALVTGGTSGIGWAVVQRFAAEGAFVYVTGRRSEQLDQVAGHLGSRGSAVRADVTALKDLDDLYRQIAADGRRLDVVVGNAGIGQLAPLEQVTEEHFDSIFTTNVRGLLFTVQKALPVLNDGASVILLSSNGADQGSEALGVYAASKAAVRSFGRTWANELKGRGIRVNTISPGGTKTPAMAANAPDPSHPEALFEMIGSQIPMGRMGEPDEVANVVLFLAGDDSSYMTGANVHVDGGQSQI